MRAIATVVLGLALLAEPVLAADLPIAPPSPMVDPYGVSVNHKTPIAQRFSLGNFKAKFNEIGVSLLAKTIGRGAVGKLPGEEVFEYVCYDLPQSRQRLWFASTDAMADGSSVDTFTTVSIESSAPKLGSCPVLPASFQPVAIDGAIRLGMTKQELLKALGQPAKMSNGWWVYGGRGDGMRQSITVKIEGERVTFLYAANTSTD